MKRLYSFRGAVHMLQTSTPEWQGDLLLLDIWGRIYGLNQGIEDVKLEIKKHVKLNKK